MNSPQDLKKAIKSLNSPDARNFNFSLEKDVEAYRAAWKALEIKTDGLVKDIVRSKALAAFGPHSKLADRAMKHCEKWRLHAQATTELWNRTWEWKAAKEAPDGYDSFLSWLGVKGTKKDWLTKEEKELQRINDRFEKVDTKLIREHELLLVEFEAVV